MCEDFTGLPRFQDGCHFVFFLVTSASFRNTRGIACHFAFSLFTLVSYSNARGIDPCYSLLLPYVRRRWTHHIVQPQIRFFLFASRQLASIVAGSQLCECCQLWSRRRGLLARRRGQGQRTCALLPSRRGRLLLLPVLLRPKDLTTLLVTRFHCLTSLLGLLALRLLLSRFSLRLLTAHYGREIAGFSSRWSRLLASSTSTILSAYLKTIQVSYYNKILRWRDWKKISIQ